MSTIDAANEPVISGSFIDSFDDKTIENIAEVVIRIWLESWQLSQNHQSLSGLYGEEDDEGDDLLSDEFFDDDDSY